MFFFFWFFFWQFCDVVPGILFCLSLHQGSPKQRFAQWFGSFYTGCPSWPTKPGIWRLGGTEPEGHHTELILLIRTIKSGAVCKDPQSMSIQDHCPDLHRSTSRTLCWSGYILEMSIFTPPDFPRKTHFAGYGCSRRWGRVHASPHMSPTSSMSSFLSSSSLSPASLPLIVFLLYFL